MTSIRLAGKSILVDEKPVFVRSGEMSYYRTDPSMWQARLDAAKDAELNCVSTYIPWAWHEPTDGSIDFNGETHPQRNLLRFLEMVAESGLYLYARPGPFINSEFRYGGHPRWLFDRYPEVWSKDSNGDPAIWRGHGVPVPTQLHPTFLGLVDRWYDAVIPRLTPYVATSGGPLLISQPDNEMNLVFTYGLGHSLYDEHTIGNGNQPGVWQDWLLERYGSLDAINRRHETHAEDPAHVQPPRVPAAGAADRRLIADWLDFKTWYIFTYASHLVRRFRELGLDVPWTMNEPVNMVFKGGDHAAASDYFRKEEGQYFTGGHIYLTGGEQDLIGVPITLYRLELVKMFDLAGPTFAAELGSGWVDLSRNRAHYNFDLLTRIALGHALDGYSLYMFSGGYNPAGTNNYGRDYHWNAPLLPDGTRHPTFENLRRLGAWIRGWESQIVDTVKEFDFYVAVSTDLPYQARWMDEVEVLSPASEDTFGYATVATKASHDAYDGVEGVLRVMTEFNANFQFVNLYHLPTKPLLDRPIIVPNSGRLAREAFALLQKHMENGQSVVFFPTVPRWDLDGNRMDEFLKAVGLDEVSDELIPIPGGEPHRTRFLTVAAAGIDEVAVDRGVRVFEGFGDGEVLAWHDGHAAVVRKQVGDGQLMMMGLYPSYLTRDSQDMFRSLLLDAAKIRRRVRSTEERLHAVVRRRPGSPTLFLTVANIAGGSGQAKIDIELDDGLRLTLPRRTDFVLDPKSVYSLWIDVDLGGLRLLHTTTELYPQDESMRRFVARGDRLAPVELGFDRPVRVQWDGAWHDSLDDNGVHLVALQHHTGESVLLVEPVSDQSRNDTERTSQ